MPYQKPPVTKLTDKFLGFCAVTPNRKFMKLFERADVKNVLISYHYIRKDLGFTDEILHMVQERGGLFMTDSGTFSFVNDKSFDADRFNWMNYLEEYVSWIDSRKRLIFSACNLDVDNFVGHNKVVNWNAKYFEPLEKDLNIIYVAQANATGRGELDVLKEYCNKYDYVAVNESMIRQVSAVYQMAKLTKTAIHGLAWTKPTILTDFPFFSVDSSSWVNYQKYGATPVWDGRNFSQHDKDSKDIRRTLRKQCINYGIKEYEFINEKNQADGTHNDDEGLTYSLRTWIDVFENLKRSARTKLTIDLNKKLQGKQVVFMEDKSGQPAQNLAQGKKGGIADALVIHSLDTQEVPLTTYEVDTATGEEVAVYQKREGKESIEAYKEKAGDTMVCNYCHVSDKCPKYKADTTCGFDFSPKEMTSNPMQIIDTMIALQNERVNRAMFFEKMEGGMPNKVFANELKLLQDLNNTKVNMLMMVQGRGLRITETVMEIGGGMDDGTPKAKGGGFADLLKNMLKGG